MKAAFYEGNKTIGVGACEPIAPGESQVRIDVAYCGVCGTDLHIFQGHMDQRVKTPLVIGHEMSGKIAEIGSAVSDWAVGDNVVVRPLCPCNQCAACRRGHGHICQNLNFIGIDSPGAFQSSWTVPAHTLHRLPEGISMDLAALIEPLAVACHDVRLGEVASGEHAVVIGGGPIGVLVAMVCRHAGSHVLISEVNPFRLQFARNLGFETVHPREQNLIKEVENCTEGEGADVVFEVSGTQAGAAVMTDLVRTRGRIVVVAIFAEPPKIDLFRFFWRELKLCGVRVYEAEDYNKAIDLVANNELPLEQLISARKNLNDLQDVFEQIEDGGEMMKTLIDTQRE